MILPYIALHYITVPYLTLLYIALPCLTLPYITLPYITFLPGRALRGLKNSPGDRNPEMHKCRNSEI